MAKSMNMAGFWDFASSSLAGTERRFRGSYYLSYYGATFQEKNAFGYIV
jgi:hypothetical protein